MVTYSRDYFRQRALARRRDPEQGARNAARIDALRGRMDALLAGQPQIEALNARVRMTDAATCVVKSLHIDSGPS